MPSKEEGFISTTARGSGLWPVRGQFRGPPVIPKILAKFCETIPAAGH
jgi:hypothetical protein